MTAAHLSMLLENDEEARRVTQFNTPMAAVAAVTVLFPILLVSVSVLAVYLIRI